MDISKALSSLSNRGSGLYSAESAIRVISPGCQNPIKKTSYKRPYNYGNAASQGKIQYRLPEKSLDNVRDPIPDKNKRERNIGDALDSYGSTLTSEQRKVFEIVMKGYNVFFTGDAGTGKSYLLRILVESLQEQVGKEKVFVTASTGIAACNIGGITVHSFAGLGIADMDINHTLRKIRQNEAAVDRWKNCSVLVIDEISMLDGHLFDTLEYVARVLRRNDYPFGGIQVVLSGDFFQLPPVGLGRNGVTYCFEARWWNAVVEHTLMMRHVFRQKDSSLQALLREIRYGRVSPTSLQLIHRMEQNTFKPHRVATSGDLDLSESDTVFVESTKLFAFNRSVDDYNQKQLDALPSPPIEYLCTDSGDDDGARYQLSRSCQAPSRLVLKRGAQVMLVKNLLVGEGLVNGCRGVVTSFRSSGAERMKLPVVTFATPRGEVTQVIEMQEFTLEAGGRVVATRKQLPLKLAWGISIHKSQGMTIDLLEVDLSGVFEAGMTYVALSRGVSSDRMSVKGFSESGVKTNKKVIAFYSAIAQGRRYVPYICQEAEKERSTSDGTGTDTVDLKSKRQSRGFNTPLAVSKAPQQTHASGFQKTLPSSSASSRANQPAQFTESLKNDLAQMPRRLCEDKAQTRPPHVQQTRLRRPEQAFDMSFQPLVSASSSLVTLTPSVSTTHAKSDSLLNLANGLQQLNRKFR